MGLEFRGWTNVINSDCKSTATENDIKIDSKTKSKSNSVDHIWTYSAVDMMAAAAGKFLFFRKTK